MSLPDGRPVVAPALAPRLVTSAPLHASPSTGVSAGGSPEGGRRRHPLEDSDLLAWQATAAVRLLERFGDELLVALHAVGGGDDAGLEAALLERDRLVTQLEPLLAALAEARAQTRDWPTSARPLDPPGTPTASQSALALILAPVDEALEHAQHLHRRLTDETRDTLARRTAAVATVRRAGRGGAMALVR